MCLPEPPSCVYQNVESRTCDLKIIHCSFLLINILECEDLNCILVILNKFVYQLFMKSIENSLDLSELEQVRVNMNSVFLFPKL